MIKIFAEECNGAKETDFASAPKILEINADGKVNFSYSEPDFPDVKGIDVQPASHSKKAGAPEGGVNVTLMGENFTSNFKVKLHFKKEGESDVKLTYPTQGVAFLDSSSNSFSINIPKTDMDDFADASGIGDYIVEAVIESN